MKKSKRIKQLSRKVFEKDAAISEVLDRYNAASERALFWERHANNLERRVFDLQEENDERKATTND